VNRFLILLAVATALLTGCAKSSSSTVVNGDGSWTRTVKLTVSKTTEDASEPFPEVFALPKDGYTATSKTEKQDKITTLVRKAQLGEGPLTDILVKENGETLCKNFVIVRRLDENRVEYYEKIVYTKAASQKNQNEIKEIATTLRGQIPQKVNATEEEVLKISNDTFQNILRLIVGPDDMLIGVLLTNPDGAERRIKSRVFKAMDQNMQKVFGDRMNADERTNAIRRFVSAMDSKKVIGDPKSTSDPSSSNGNMVGMSTSVKFPGKVLETNGEIDPLTGEVYWDYLSIASEVAPLELRAICELKQ
jgi:hypothetical protein